MKFFSRLFLTFTPLIILPIAFIGWMAARNNSRNHQEIEDLGQNINRLEAQAKISSQSITRAFEEKTRADYEYIIHQIKLGLELSLTHLDRALQNAMDFAPLRSFLNHPSGLEENEKSAVVARLKLAIKFNDISNLYIIDKSGKELVRLQRKTDQVQSLKPRSSKFPIPVASEGKTVSPGQSTIIEKKIYFDNHFSTAKKGQPMISFVAPVYSKTPPGTAPDSQISGYIRFEMPISTLMDKIVGTLLLEDALVIINRRGEIIFHRDPSEIGNNFLKYSAFKDNFLVFSDFAANGLFQINIFADKKKLARKTEGVQALTESISRQVDTINGSSARLKKHIEIFSQSLIMITVLIAVITLIIVFATARVFSAPIKHLIGQAGKITAGELDSGMKSSASDEIGELSRHLDAMRIHLKSHITDLDKMVLKRTTELTKTNEQLHQEIIERKRSEAQKEKLIADLQAALTEIRDLRGILPLCSFCKKIRDDKGYWQQVEVYIQKHSQADISHSICPDCLEKHYPDEI